MKTSQLAFLLFIALVPLVGCASKADEGVDKPLMTNAPPPPPRPNKPSISPAGAGGMVPAPGATPGATGA